MTMPPAGPARPASHAAHDPAETGPMLGGAPRARSRRSVHDGSSRLAQRASRLVFTKQFGALYVVGAAINVALLVWSVADARYLSDESTVAATWFVALDALASVLLLFEVLIRAAASFEAFWASTANRIDLVIMLFSVSALCLYAVDWETLVASALLSAVRYGAQLVRLCLIVKHQMEHSSMVRASTEHFVDFRMIEPDVVKEQTLLGDLEAERRAHDMARFADDGSFA